MSSLHGLVVGVLVPQLDRHAERVDVAVAQLDLCGKFDARCMGGERWWFLRSLHRSARTRHGLCNQTWVQFLRCGLGTGDAAPPPQAHATHTITAPTARAPRQGTQQEGSEAPDTPSRCNSGALTNPNVGSKAAHQLPSPRVDLRVEDEAQQASSFQLWRRVHCKRQPTGPRACWLPSPTVV